MTALKVPKFLRYMDYSILFASLALAGIGIISIYSSGVDAEGVNTSTEYLKQALWAVSGFFLMLFAASFDISRFKDYSIFLYILLMVVLVYTRLAGKVVNGAKSWLGIGDYGIQPSEFAKIATILFLARYLDASEQEGDLARLVRSGFIIGLPAVLILSQPDFGTALVFFPILLFMIFTAGLNRQFIYFILATIMLTFGLLILPLSEKYLLHRTVPVLSVLHRAPYQWFVIAAVGLVTALSAWGWRRFRKTYYYRITYAGMLTGISLLMAIAGQKALKEYQIMRLMVFLDPDIDPRGSGWNIIQAITAIGSGGITGKGFLQGTQSHARYIPQQSTDFIFSIVAEEWGFLGGLAVFSLFLVIFLRCVHILATCKDRYSMYVTSGVFGMFFFHFMINAGMAMGIMPITGIPLYFLSYGGSSLWTAMSAIGLLLGISARRYKM